MQFGDTVTLVNRTRKTRQCKWNGVDYVLPSGETPNCPAKVASAAIEQNKRMGSQHPNNPSHYISLFGIKGHPKWPTTPLEQSMAVEVLDRSKLAPAARNPRLDDLGGATYFDAMDAANVDMSLDIANAAD